MSTEGLEFGTFGRPLACGTSATKESDQLVSTGKDKGLSLEDFKAVIIGDDNGTSDVFDN